MDEVQLEDVKTEEEVVEVQQYDFEGIQAALKGNPELAEEYRSCNGDTEKEDAFLAKYLKKDESKTEEPEKDAEVEEEVDEEIELKVKKSVLGTYENVDAMAEGVQEKDKHINFLKEETDGIKSKLEKANEEIAELKKVSAKPEEKTEKIEIPKLPDNVDLDEDEGQKEYRKYTQELASTLEKALGEISTLKAEVGTVKSGVSDVTNKIETSSQKTDAKSAAAEEFKEADALVEKHSELIKTKRSVEEIEKDVIEFTGNIMKIAGVDAGLYDKDGSGRYSPEAVEVQKKFNNDTGFRKQCNERGQKLPDDMEALDTIYAIRKVKTDSVSGITYEKAFKRWAAENEDLVTKARMEGEEKGRKTMEKAVENRKGFAKEAPVEGGSNLIDLSKIDPNVIAAIADKSPKSRNDKEKQILTEALKAENPGITQEELDGIVGVKAS